MELGSESYNILEPLAAYIASPLPHSPLPSRGGTKLMLLLPIRAGADVSLALLLPPGLLDCCRPPRKGLTKDAAHDGPSIHEVTKEHRGQSSRFHQFYFFSFPFLSS